jgi:hypothetical protein
MALTEGEWESFLSDGKENEDHDEDLEEDQDHEEHEDEEDECLEDEDAGFGEVAEGPGRVVADDHYDGLRRALAEEHVSHRPTSFGDGRFVYYSRCSLGVF